MVVFLHQLWIFVYQTEGQLGINTTEEELRIERDIPIMRVRPNL